MPSDLDVAKRALVVLLRSLALAFGCKVAVTRDSSEAEVRRAFRSVARKVHPDKPGGSEEESKKLNAAHDAWERLLKNREPAGRPSKAGKQERQAKSSAGAAAVVAPLPLCACVGGGWWSNWQTKIC